MIFATFAHKCFSKHGPDSIIKLIQALKKPECIEMKGGKRPMVIDKNRYLVILYQLISDTKPMSSIQLAQLAMVTPKTIKYDIAVINEKLKAERIAEILSYKSKGYKIAPLDEAKYDEFKRNLIEMHILFQDANIEAINRRLYILQKLFIHEFVKTDDMAEELYVSKSVLTNDLAWVNQFFKSYYISTKSVSGKGLTIEGQEQDLRSAMVEVYVSLYQHYTLISSDSCFRNFFYAEEEEYRIIRRTVLHILRRSRIQLTELNASKLTAYICLAKNRNKNGRPPRLPREAVRRLKETYEYVLAGEIAGYKALQLFEKDMETEILNLARLLVIYRDIDLRDEKCLKSLPHSLLEENRRIFQTIISEITADTGNRLFQTEAFKQHALELESLQMKILLEHTFDHTSTKHLFWFTEESESLASPYSLELVRMLILKLQNHFGELVSGDTVVSFAAVFKHILDQIPFSYKKRRLIVTSMEGLITSRIIKEFLEKRYRSYISRIECYNLYEMRKLDFSQYDAVIHSGIASYFNYPVKCVSYRELDFMKDGDEQLFEKIFAEGYCRMQVSKASRMLQIYKNEKANDIDRFLELLSYKYCREKAIQPKMLTGILEKGKIIRYLYPKSGTYLILFNHYDTSTEFWDIYELAQNIYYNNLLKIKYVVAVCISPETSLPDTRAFDMILQYLVNHKNDMEQLVSGKMQPEDLFRITVRNDFLFSL